MAETEKVAVITGASSGIGRATAETLARQGWRLVLVARERSRLEDVVRAFGGEHVAKPVEGDVADPETHDTLLREAVQAFGGCSLWINNAAVAAFGRIDKIPAEIHERQIRTNLIGTILGSRVAVAHFLARGEGQLINVASMAGSVPQPYAATYSASKFGIRGFVEAVRAELHDHPEVLVNMVSPAAIDSAFWEHAANYTGTELKPVQPLYEPQAVADAIVGLIGSRKMEVFVGDFARLTVAGHALAPGLAEATAVRQMENQVMTGERQPHDPGSVLAPRGTTAIDGGWTERGLASGATMDTVLRAVGAGAVAVGVGYAISRLFAGRDSDHDRHTGSRATERLSGSVGEGEVAGGYRYGRVPSDDERQHGDGRGHYGRHGQPGGPEPVAEGEEAFRRAGW